MPYYVYILTNYTNSVLYTGVTNDLQRRMSEHRQRKTAGFTRRYNVWKLVYYEQGEEVLPAIEREKQIKAGSRAKKVALIAAMNPQWRDLWPEIQDGSVIARRRQPPWRSLSSRLEGTERQGLPRPGGLAMTLRGGAA